MVDIKVNQKTDINPMGFTYTPTAFHEWVGDVAKVIKKTFEPIGLENTALYFFNYRVDSRSNDNIEGEIQCLNLHYSISKEAKNKYNFDKNVDITLMATGKTVLEKPTESHNGSYYLECCVHDMVDALHFFKMLQIALPIQIEYSINNETNEKCCRPFGKGHTNGKICFDL